MESLTRRRIVSESDETLLNLNDLRQKFGSASNFMASYGLSPHVSRDCAEAKKISRALKRELTLSSPARPSSPGYPASYQCRHCDTVFLVKSYPSPSDAKLAWEDHMRRLGRAYECGHCHLRFSEAKYGCSKAALAECVTHESQAHSVGLDNSVSSILSRSGRIADHFFCPSCPQFFLSSSECAEHEVTAHPRNFTCDFCDREFFVASYPSAVAAERSRDNHRLTHVFTCSFCTLEFSAAVHGSIEEARFMRAQHEASVHRKSFFCSLCGREFFIGSYASAGDAERARDNHERNAHNFRCSHCPMEFSALSWGSVVAAQEAFDRHVSSVHPRSYGCRFCEKKFFVDSYGSIAVALKARDFHEYDGHVLSCKLCGEEFSAHALGSTEYAFECLEEHERAVHLCFGCHFCERDFWVSDYGSAMAAEIARDDHHKMKHAVEIL